MARTFSRLGALSAVDLAALVVNGRRLAGGRTGRLGRVYGDPIGRRRRPLDAKEIFVVAADLDHPRAISVWPVASPLLALDEVRHGFPTNAPPLPQSGVFALRTPTVRCPPIRALATPVDIPSRARDTVVTCQIFASPPPRRSRRISRRRGRRTQVFYLQTLERVAIHCPFSYCQ
jgi:hypothetical protein